MGNKKKQTNEFDNYFDDDFEDETGEEETAEKEEKRSIRRTDCDLKEKET